MSEEKHYFKYGYFVRNPPGSEYKWTCHTVWSHFGETKIPSFYGGTATVQVSDDAVRGLGFEEAGMLAYDVARRGSP